MLRAAIQQPGQGELGGGGIVAAGDFCNPLSVALVLREILRVQAWTVGLRIWFAHLTREHPFGQWTVGDKTDA